MDNGRLLQGALVGRPSASAMVPGRTSIGTADMTWRIDIGDCLDVLRPVPAESVDACLCDPPAGIAFMGRDWDDARGGMDAWVEWLAVRLAEVRRVLKPGGACLVWAIPRTSHWTACAVERAGLLIGAYNEAKLYHAFGQGWNKHPRRIKPAMEEWIFAHAPISERTIEANVERWGLPYCGVEECRVAGVAQTPRSIRSARRFDDRNPDHGLVDPPLPHPAGRRPSTFLLSHAPGCRCVGEKHVHANQSHTVGSGKGPNEWFGGGIVRQSTADSDGLETVEAWECVEGCAVRLLDEQSGELHGAGNLSLGNPFDRDRNDGKSIFNTGAGAPSTLYDRGGTASRFFPTFPSDPFHYAAKECPSGRHAGAWDLLWAVDPSRPSGVRPVAAEEWEALSERERRRGNVHATVKSQGLMRWLVKLACPPNGTLIDPFAGSGSTLCAAVSTGRNAIGIEQEADYATIARARVEWAEKHPPKERKPKLPRTQPAAKVIQIRSAPEQMRLAL